jgi:hypothetical protein
LTILHFSGKFKYYPPIYNNEPRNSEKYFNPQIDPETVKRKITNRVDPLKYFEFEFSDVYIRKVTYNDTSFSTEKNQDEIIGKKILLKGLLVDVSPHLERGRLFAGEIRIIDFMMGKLELAVQSDLFETIRNDTDKGAQTLSANFESKIYDLNYLENMFLTVDNSRFLRELQTNNFKIHYNVRKFDFNSLEGEINGYFGPYIAEENSEGVRLSGRRLLINPEIDSKVKSDLSLENIENESEDVFRYDLELTYEIVAEKRMLILRYLQAIPFIDVNDNIPRDYHFFIVLLYKGKRIKIGPNLTFEINLDPQNIILSGGTHILHIPSIVKELDKLQLEIEVTRDSKNFYKYMKEPKYDLSFINNQKFLILESNEKRELQIRIFKENRITNKDIDLEIGHYEVDRSPTVAFCNEKLITKDGITVCYIQALNLENSEEIEDPISGVYSDTEEIRVKLSGDLPWDRYYGNYVYVKLKDKENKKKSIIKYNIPVRVLHSIDLKKAKEELLDGLNREGIQKVVTKMLTYYTRYYPWLHVEYRYKVSLNNPPQLVYNQFLKITEFLNFIEEEDLNHWHIVEHTVTKINHFLERLEKDDHDWKKMPRSRDFPFHGVEFFKMWKTSIIDKVIEEIEEQRNNPNQENLDKVDFGNWEGIQELISKLDNLTTHISDDDKKLILQWKLYLLEEMIKILTHAKSSTKHFHSH